MAEEPNQARLRDLTALKQQRELTAAERQEVATLLRAMQERQSAAAPAGPLPPAPY